jgi:hypothetical protein
MVGVLSGAAEAAPFQTTIFETALAMRARGTAEHLMFPDNVESH